MTKRVQIACLLLIEHQLAELGKLLEEAELESGKAELAELYSAIVDARKDLEA